MLRRRYANVAATLALLLGVGGVSYAAVRLPANSVGRAQLRAASVTPRALGFPLSARTKVDQRLHRIHVAATCEVANGVAPPCVPPAAVTLTTTKVVAGGGGHLTLSGLLGITLGGVTSGDVRISVSGTIDGRRLPGAGTITIPAGATAPPERQLTYLSGARVPAGSHHLALRLTTAGPAGAEVRVSPISLSAQISP